MARSNELYNSRNEGDNPYRLFTPAYHRWNVAYWMRASKWWKQAAWVAARKGEEKSFTSGLKSFHRAHAMMESNRDSLKNIQSGVESAA